MKERVKDYKNKFGGVISSKFSWEKCYRENNIFLDIYTKHYILRCYGRWHKYETEGRLVNKYASRLAKNTQSKVDMIFVNL